MENEENFFAASGRKVEEYVKDRILLLKLEITEKASRLMASMVTGLLLVFFAFLIMLFLSIVGAYLLGELLGHLYLGFIIVTGIHLILLLLLLRFGKHFIEKRVMALVVEVFFSDQKHQDEPVAGAGNSAGTAEENTPSSTNKDTTHE
ncbi:MAG TPA: phage holin family protein [Chitinophagaceae bacterium]|jgi:hypothetical protein|nr:phage holin family protein [Chitinophagaceae bacterium]